MFKFFKNILAGRSAENTTVATNWKAPQHSAPPQMPRARSATAPALTRTQPLPKPASSVSENRASNGGGNDGHVRLGLRNVLNGLPDALKSRVRQFDVGDAEISIPLEKVLSQLSQGAVKITFGQMRRAAPQIFTSQNDSDETPVALPLGEILSQLNPALLFRRQNQKQIEVPDDIRSPFGDHGQGLIFSVGPTKAPAPAPAPARTVTPVISTSLAQSTPPASRPLSSPSQSGPMPTIPFRRSITSTPTPPVPSAIPAGFPPPAGPVQPANRGVGATFPMASPAPAPAPAAPVARPIAPAVDVPVLNIPVSLVMEGWPESLRMEIAQLNVADAKIAVPVDTLKEALQRGKVFFTWKALRAWIKPALAPSVSAHDNTSVELPLKVLAPLFVARQKEAIKAQQKVAIDETIPNLFFGFPQGDVPTGGTPAPASCAVTRPVDTNFYSLDDTPDAPAAQEAPVKRTAPGGTAFLTRCATPNEIVSRAAALNGVSGALIALPDGLMVASKLSADLNGDTLAAFLPQIFGKVNQCTKELRMGELNNLNFTVGNVPWKIFRVNAIFFAAFGRPSQPLPTAELAALAGELDRKKQ